MAKINITLVRSPIGYNHQQKKIVKSLGISRMNQTVTQDDSPSIRGMIDKVKHLVHVEEQK